MMLFKTNNIILNKNYIYGIYRYMNRHYHNIEGTKQQQIITCNSLLFVLAVRRKKKYVCKGNIIDRIPIYLHLALSRYL